ncbi:hypothetical protein Bbelb_342650 [Branchiostoma belcheri]|nr:hypothetical protein Bbelb_342650 [Branchiostoma belcheri]
MWNDQTVALFVRSHPLKLGRDGCAGCTNTTGDPSLYTGSSGNRDQKAKSSRFTVSLHRLLTWPKRSVNGRRREAPRQTELDDSVNLPSCQCPRLSYSKYLRRASKLQETVWNTSMWYMFGPDVNYVWIADKRSSLAHQTTVISQLHFHTTSEVKRRSHSADRSRVEGAKPCKGASRDPSLAGVQYRNSDTGKLDRRSWKEVSTFLSPGDLHEIMEQTVALVVILSAIQIISYVSSVRHPSEVR